MEDGSIPLLVAMVILVILSGFFSASETAYSSLNQIRLKSRADSGDQKAAQILAEIEGLALYLGTAEASRLNTFNPPDRTPEEFHRFMPYAVALGLEKAWGAQFATSLADLQFRGSSLQRLAEYEHRMQGR